MNAFAGLGEICFVPVWCNHRVCLEGIPTMAAWSDGDHLVNPVTAGKGGISGYLAKETALTSSEGSGAIAKDVVIHEQFLLEFWGQNGHCKLPI
jgi:hypothetical protein